MAEHELAPIALFVYNRPEHTRSTLDALRANALAGASDLFIFSDASRSPQAQAGVNQVRELISHVGGFKSVTVVERARNMGLAGSITDGVTWLCEERGQVIVLEDDLVVSPHFLQYMNDGLDFYRDDEQVISIHGYIYPVKGALPETFFLRGADCWGWATWRRGWQHFEPDGQRLLDEIQRRGLEKEFNFDGAYDYVGLLRDQIAGRVDSWAVRWYASAFLPGRLTLYPGMTLVQNIGMDNSGTHCEDSSAYDTVLNLSPVRVEGIPLEEDRAAKKQIVRFFRSIRPSFVRRCLNRLRAIARFGA